MDTTRTPIVDKNGKPTHVHRGNDKPAAVGRVADISSKSPAVEPAVSDYPLAEKTATGQHIKIDGFTFRADFTFVNRLSPDEHTISLHRSANDSYTVSSLDKEFNNRVLSVDETVELLNSNYGGEYWTVQNGKAAQERAETQAAIARVQAEKDAFREAVIVNSGFPREQVEAWLEKLVFDADSAGYDRGWEAGDDNGYNRYMDYYE